MPATSATPLGPGQANPGGLGIGVAWTAGGRSERLANFTFQVRGSLRARPRHVFRG